MGDSPKKKLKIGIVAPISERVPPKKYGGTERVVYVLTNELVKKGHDVTLFATGDSITKAKLVSVFPRSLREARMPNPHGINEWTLLNIGNAYFHQDEFDIIHDHNSLMGLPTAAIARTPVVLTIHGALNQNNRKLYEILKGPYLIGISNAQIASARNISIYDVVYNGLSMKRYPYREKHKGYLLYVGRISMEKGTHHAIDVARNLDMPLIIAAKVDTVDKSYFKEFVEPYLSNENIQYIGEVGEKERNVLMSEAMCLLHPVTWREPFGLTMIESMACGSPVIAFRKGSIPEIVEDGKTGFVVEDVDEMAEAVMSIDSIDREYCRQYAINKFNSRKMADNYERIYYKILNSM